MYGYLVLSHGYVLREPELYIYLYYFVTCTIRHNMLELLLGIIVFFFKYYNSSKKIIKYN